MKTSYLTRPLLPLTFALSLSACAGSLDAVDETSLDEDVGEEQTAAASSALAGQHWGYVLADQPLNPGLYYPDFDHQFNSLGYNNTVTRTGTGAYSVSFTNLGGPKSGAPYTGIEYATAVGASGAHCKVGHGVAGLIWFGSVRPYVVAVRCFQADGTPADTAFTAGFTTAPTFPAYFGYAFADKEAVASYTPDEQYDSEGGPITIARTGTGLYTVKMPGLAPIPGEPYPGPGGDATVVAYGEGSTRCKVASWAPTGAVQNVYVRCFDAAGQAANSMFNVAFTRRGSLFGHIGLPRAYVLADQPAAASYTPTAAFNYSASSLNTVVRHGVGDYTVTLPGLASPEGHVHVTAHGKQADYCGIDSWGPSGGSQLVGVRCFNASGLPVDSQYTMIYSKY